MFTIINAACIIALLYFSISFLLFIYMWRRPKLWHQLQTIMKFSLIALAIVSVILATILTYGRFAGFCNISDAGLAAAWTTFLCILLCQAIIFGCFHNGVKVSENAILLAVIDYGASLLAVTYSVFLFHTFAEHMSVSIYGDIGQDIVGLIIFILFWYYIRLVGNLNSPIYTRLSIGFIIVAGVGILAMAISPFTNFATYLDPVSHTSITEKGYIVVAVVYVILCVFGIIILIKTRIEPREKSSLILLAATIPFTVIIYLFAGSILVSPLFVAIGSLGCYLSIVVRRNREEERYHAQIEMASIIQQGLLPRSFPEDSRFNMSAQLWPSKEVSDDFYDFFQPDDDHIYITVVDVLGKDVPAALLMSKIHALVREFEKAGYAPNEILRKINVSLAPNNKQKLFASAWMGRIDLADGVMIYANAGHCSPVIYRHGSGATFLETKQNPLIGEKLGAQYTREAVLLNKGDRILLYTDEITQSLNANQEAYGTKRLLNFVQRTIDFDEKRVAESLFEEVKSFAGNVEQKDDIAVLCVTFLGDSLTNAADYAEKVFPAEKSELDNVNSFIECSCARMNCPEDYLFNLGLAVEELFVNVCSYAYVNSPEIGTIRISVKLMEDEIQILFADFGVPFNPLLQEPPNFEERSRKRTVGGLGIYLVRELMDDVHYDYSEGENRLTIIKKLG